MPEAPIKVLTPDRILVDWGPMTLTVSIWDRGEPRPVMAVKAARKALETLTVLADFKYYLKKNQKDLPLDRPLPSAVSRAVKACRRISGDLTPMAAVAGAAADETADFAAEMGADKIIVNNGGDIALRLAGNAGAVVGVRRSGEDFLRGKLNLKAGGGIGGVASSGWSGRSFSPGTADLVTVWAETASLADAAATFLAGRADVSGREIVKVQARELDPESDLGSRPVTARVGRLSEDQRQRALSRGSEAGQALLEAGAISGCFILVQGDSVLIDPDGLMSSV